MEGRKERMKEKKWKEGRKERRKRERHEFSM